MKCPAPSSRRPCGAHERAPPGAPWNERGVGPRGKAPAGPRPVQLRYPSGHTGEKCGSGLRRGAMQVSSAVRIIRTGDVRSPATASSPHFSPAHGCGRGSAYIRRVEHGIAVLGCSTYLRVLARTYGLPARRDEVPALRLCPARPARPDSRSPCEYVASLRSKRKFEHLHALASRPGEKCGLTRVKTPRGTRIARWYCPESHTTCRRRSEDAREWPV